MTLGMMYDALEFQGPLDPFSDYYLRGAYRKSDLYAWRGLVTDDLPDYLNRIKACPETNLGSWP
jgi:hypothetical protein